MRYLITCGAFVFLLTLPARAQIGPIDPQINDCSNCTNAEWGAQFNPSTGGCASNPSMGCGSGCNCWMGLMAVVTVTEGKASAKSDFFGGAFTKDGGFRIDRPGPLARNHVKAGDVAYRINGRKPRKSHLGTAKRPIRRAEATWDDQGRLRLKLWH